MAKNTAQHRDGFSLLELLVALFILASLVGISVPIYLNEMNKSQVAAALGTLSGLEQAAKAAYEENTSNSSITFAGNTINNSTITSLPAGSVVNVEYIGPGGNANVASNQFLVCVFVGNLSFSGYVAPTAGAAGSYSRLCKQVTASDPIYTNMCGALQGNSSDIPTTYLPKGCNCANIWGNSC